MWHMKELPRRLCDPEPWSRSRAEERVTARNPPGESPSKERWPERTRSTRAKALLRDALFPPGLPEGQKRTLCTRRVVLLLQQLTRKTRAVSPWAPMAGPAPLRPVPAPVFPVIGCLPSSPPLAPPPGD